jgi:hypothetical protein
MAKLTITVNLPDLGNGVAVGDAFTMVINTLQPMVDEAFSSGDCTAIRRKGDIIDNVSEAKPVRIGRWTIKER